QVQVKLPIGTALNKTNETMKQIEQAILANPNVATAFSASGTTLNLRGATGALTPHLGSVTVKLKEDRKQSTFQVVNNLRRQLSRLPGVRAFPNQTDLITMIMTGGPTNLEMDIIGPDITTLSN